MYKNTRKAVIELYIRVQEKKNKNKDLVTISKRKNMCTFSQHRN